MSKYLTRAGIIEQTHGYRTAEMEIPEWGGTVLVRELTANQLTQLGIVSANLQADQIEAAQEDPELVKVNLDMSAIVDLFPLVVSWCVVDENMRPILTAEDVQGMTGSSVAPIQRIVAKAMELTGVSDDEAEEPDPNA